MEDSMVNQAWFPFLLILTELLLAGVMALMVALIKRVSQNRVDLLEYKLEAANTYAKDDEVKDLLKQVDHKLDQVLLGVHHNN